jgi:hypothetical protein
MLLQSTRDWYPDALHVVMHTVPRSWVVPEGPQHTWPVGQSDDPRHMTGAPPSVQSAGAAQTVVATVVLVAQQYSVPSAVFGEHATGQEPLPVVARPPLLLLLLEPAPLLPLLLEPAPLLLLLPPGGGVVGLFDPQPPVVAAATAVARPTPMEAKNNTRAFLMRGPYPLLSASGMSF